MFVVNVRTDMDNGRLFVYVTELDNINVYLLDKNVNRFCGFEIII